MAVVKPFPCLRPSLETASRVAALPYDVYDRGEAREVVEKEPLSFLAIDRPETQFPPDADMYSAAVYEKAADMIGERLRDGIFVRDDQPCFYLYEQIMDGRSQTGIVGCSAVDDYLSGVICRHENTREEKEQDRIRHIDICKAQTGPIFLAFRSHEGIRALLEKEKEKPCLYDFTSAEGVGQRVWRLSDEKTCQRLEEMFREVPRTYIADGHHRAASAVKVGLKRREQNPGFTGEEPFNYFLSVLFPQEELCIMDYNRLVRDLNGLTPEEFFEKLAEEWELIPVSGAEEAKPKKKGQVGLFLSGRWYRMEKKNRQYYGDPVKDLDVSMLQESVLSPILGIRDPRLDKRIDFIGGIRGLKELERRCSLDGKAAFAMYPTSMEELFAVADAGLLMPPKSTWFEPKLLSGLFIHEI